jgi:hypothetical protein
LLNTLPQAKKAYPIVRAEQKLAVRDAARYVQAQAAKYPAKGQSQWYRRTGTLGRSIAVGPVHAESRGVSAEVGTNKHYARYVEYGTGLYGPKGARIKPKTARALAWRAVGVMGAEASVGRVLIASGISKRRGKIKANAARDVYMVFARSIRGMHPWHFMEKAFKAPETKAYFEQRLQQMWARIKAALS